MDQKTHLVRMEQWAPIIKECCASGLSKRAWCMQNGIKVKQFYYWQRKLRDYSYDLAIAASSMTETPQPKFVELPGPVTSGAYNDSSDFIPSVIIKSNNATIEISNAASRELLSLIGGMLNVQ